MSELYITHTPAEFQLVTPGLDPAISNLAGESEGGQTIKAEDFKVDDGSLPRDLVLKAIGINKQDFLRNYAENFGAKRAEKVRLAIDDIYSDISSGVAYGRLLNRNLKFNDGRVRDASGKADDPYRVATYFINLVLDATYPEYVKVLKKREEEAKAAEEKLKADLTYSSQLLNRHFYDYLFAGDVTPEMAAGWAQASVEERISAYRNFIASELLNLNNFKYTSGYADIEDARLRLLAADRALQDGDVSSADMLILGRAGIRGAMFNPAVATSTAAPASPQELLAAELARYAALSQQLAAERYAAWNNWTQLRSNWKPGKEEGVVYYKANKNWKDLYKLVGAPAFKKWFDEDMFQSHENWSKETKQLFEKLGLLNGERHIDAGLARAFMLYAACSQAPDTNSGQIVNENTFEFHRTLSNGTTLPTGLIVYTKTINPNDGTVYIFDVRTGKYGKYYIQSLDPELINDIEEEYKRSHNLLDPNSTPSQKSGGILKAARGFGTGDFGKSGESSKTDSETPYGIDFSADSVKTTGQLPADSKYRVATQSEIDRLKALTTSPAKLSNVDIFGKFQNEGRRESGEATTDTFTSDDPELDPFRTEWKTEDYARAISALGDIASLFGTLPNVIGSGVSTVADLFADVADDKVSKTQVAGNLFNNIGWGLVGLVPGGKASKAKQALQNILPIVSLVFAGAGAKAAISGYDEFARIVKKKLDGEELTTTERQYSANYIRELTGALGYATGRVRAATSLNSRARDLNKDYKNANNPSSLNYTIHKERKPDASKGEVGSSVSSQSRQLSPEDIRRLDEAGKRGGQAEFNKTLTEIYKEHGYDMDFPSQGTVKVTSPSKSTTDVNYGDKYGGSKGMVSRAASLLDRVTGSYWRSMGKTPEGHIGAPQPTLSSLFQDIVSPARRRLMFGINDYSIDRFNKKYFKLNESKLSKVSENPIEKTYEERMHNLEDAYHGDKSGGFDADHLTALKTTLDKAHKIGGISILDNNGHIKSVSLISSEIQASGIDAKKALADYEKNLKAVEHIWDGIKTPGFSEAKNGLLNPYRAFLKKLKIDLGISDSNNNGGILSLYREGGSLFGPRRIIWALEGTALTWNDIIGNLASKWNVDVANAGTREYDTSRLVNLDFKLGYRDAWLSPEDARQGGAYYAPIASASGDLPNGTTTSTHAAYVRDVEGGDYNWSKPTNYYQQFTRDLIDYKDDGTINYNNGRGGLTELGVKFAHDTDALLADEKSKIFKSDGTMNTEWSTIGTNANGKKGTVYKNAADYLLARRMDLILGVAHNGYLGKGIRYYRRNADGTKLYLDPKLVEANKDKGIFTMGDPEKQDYDTLTQTQWTDFEIKGLEKAKQQAGQKTDLDRTPGDGTELPEGYPSKKNNPSYLSGLGELIASYLTGLPRIALLNHAAKKNLDLSRKRLPYQKIAPWYQRQVLNDNIGNLIANTAMAQTRNTAQRISSNSTDLRESAAVQLQGEANNAQTALQQAQRDNAYIERRRAEAERIGDTNISNLVNVANDNRQLRWADREQKLQDEAIYNSKVANNWATWLAEKEYDFKRDMYKRRAEKEAWNMANLSITVDGKTYTGGTVKEFLDSILANDKEYQDDLAKVLAYYANPTDEKLKEGITAVIARMQLKEQQTLIQARNLFRQAYANYKNFPYNKPTTSFRAKSAVPAEREGGSIKRTTKTSTAYATELLRQLGKDADRFMRSMDKLHDRNARLVALISIPYVLEVMKILK